MLDEKTKEYTGIPELGISPEEEALFDAMYKRELRYWAVIAVLVFILLAFLGCWLIKWLIMR